MCGMKINFHGKLFNNIERNNVSNIIKTTPALGVEIYDNAINNCDKIIEWLDEKIWERSKVAGNDALNISEKRTSKSVFVPMLSFNNPDFIYEMNKQVWTLIDEYGKAWDTGFSGIENVSIQKYDIGDYYDLHTDSGPGIPRIISCVVYLNTVNNGGRTIFPYLDTAVNAVEGRAVVFPSNFIYAHEAETPQSNIKYAAAFWASI